MPDFSTASVALTAITQALDTAKMLKELGKRLDNAEIIAQVADLSMNLAEVRMQLAQALEEKLQLKQDLEQLKQIGNIRQKLIRDGNVYRFREPIDDFGEGPFCMRCFDVDGRLVNVRIYSTGYRRESFACDECDRQSGK